MDDIDEGTATSQGLQPPRRLSNQTRLDQFFSMTPKANVINRSSTSIAQEAQHTSASGSGKKRRFNSHWSDKYEDGLECSESKDANGETEGENSDYVKNLKIYVTATKLFLRGGQALWERDESVTSYYQGRFLDLVKEFRELENIPECREMTSPTIRKELSRTCAFLTTSKICREIGDDVYSILANVTYDCSRNEQMGVVVRYVDSKGGVVERFLGIEQLKETNVISLKNAVENILTKNNLSMSMIRGQGYDGGSNLSDSENGLKTLIQNEYRSAFYVHCFAHQLELALVAAAKRNIFVGAFFSLVDRIITIIGTNKRHELLRDKQFVHLSEIIEGGLVESGRGLNQHPYFSLTRVGNSGWGLLYKTLLSLMNLYDVLETLVEDAIPDVRALGNFLADELLDFDFIFMLCLLVDVLGVTHDLNLALKRREQDLLNALNLVTIAKLRLQKMRDSGWEALFNKVVEICDKHGIDMPTMDGPYHMLKKNRFQVSSITNLHHFKNDCFFSILDVQLKELNERFNMESIELLQCVACLSPSSLFAAFDEDKLIRMMKFYPNDFLEECESSMRNQLANYIMDVQSDSRFSKLKGLVDLSTTLVATNKSVTYSAVYKLVKFALLLPVETASVQRDFSTIEHVKSDLRSEMGDEWLSDRLVAFVERDILMTISEDDILTCFQKMNPRKCQI